MASLSIVKTIDAPIAIVFNTIANSNQYSKAVSQVIKMEILSDVKSGLGTRFRETRLMNGKEVSNDLEITEYAENDRVRIVADSHGTVWDSLFIFKENNESTELNLTMIATAYKLLPKLMNPLAMGLIKKAVEKDMNAIKTFCEKSRIAQ